MDNHEQQQAPTTVKLGSIAHQLFHTEIPPLTGAQQRTVAHDIFLIRHYIGRIYGGLVDAGVIKATVDPDELEFVQQHDPEGLPPDLR